MTGETDVSLIVKSIIETQIIQALNNSPDAIEKMVKAALSRPVDKSGDPNSFSSNKVPFLEWLVGNEIRHAAQIAVGKIVKEQTSRIEAEVRKGLTAESVVSAVTKAFVRATDQDWRINVTFEAEKN